MNNQPNPPNASGGAKVYEMQWDCRFCGTKKLLGKTHRFCPNCGGQQDPSWRYFPSDAEKVAVQDHVYVGADKICSACKSLNSANAEFCGNCGAPMSKAAEAKKVGERTKGEGEAFETENLKERQKAQQVPALAAAPPASAKPKGRSKLPIILLAIVVLVGGGIFALTRTTTNNIYVTGYRWERSIEIEALGPVADSGSCDTVPVDAYGRDRRYEQVGSHQEADGETCSNKQVDQGDGTFREERECKTNYKDVPDYGYVCYYTVNRWTHSRTAQAEGDKTVTVVWPETNVRSGNIIGSERESSRDEKYYLVFKGDGDKTYECPVPVDQWNATTMESAFTVQVGAVLKNVRCETLKPAA